MHLSHAMLSLGFQGLQPVSRKQTGARCHGTVWVDLPKSGVHSSFWSFSNALGLMLFPFLAQLPDESFRSLAVLELLIRLSYWLICKTNPDFRIVPCSITVAKINLELFQGRELVQSMSSRCVG
jgi:hypothetical protein